MDLGNLVQRLHRMITILQNKACADIITLKCPTNCSTSHILRQEKLLGPGIKPGGVNNFTFKLKV